MMSERVLIDEIRKGNRRAMQELYSHTVGYVVGVCQRYLSNQEDVRDVVQDCYLQFFQHIDGFTYKGENSIRAWMTRVVINKSIDLLRHQRHWQFADEEVPDIADKPIDLNDIKAERLHCLIRQLPTGYRTILNLYVFEKKSHQEIAKIMGIKPDTSASQYHRAKALLKKLILQNKEDFA